MDPVMNNFNLPTALPPNLEVMDLDLQPLGVPATKLPARRQPSAAEWVMMRPRIQELYIDDNKPFGDVAEALKAEFNFSPSKHQFMDKIKAWGMCKNMKRAQRLAAVKILEAGEANVGMMGPVRLNKGKVTRWKKEAQSMGALDDESVVCEVGDGMTLPPSDNEDLAIVDGSAAVAPESDEMEGIEEIQREYPPLTPSERALERFNETLQDPVFKQELGVTKTYWDAADILGSPKLSRLMEALRIVAEIPELSLDDDEGPPEDGCISPEMLLVVKKPPRAKRAKPSLVGCEQAIVSTRKRGRRSSSPDVHVQSWLFQALQNSVNPLHEIDVFPIVVDLEEEETNRQQLEFPRTPLQQQLKEHKEILRSFEKLQLSSESDAVLEEMEKLAGIYIELGKYHSAELLYHQIAVASEKRWGEDHHRTLYAALRVVRMKMVQGYYSQAMMLHQTLHPRILKVADSGSALMRNSISYKPFIDRNYNRTEESENCNRQLLQICLTKYGLRNIDTWKALTDMAHASAYSKPASSEYLFRIAQQLKDEVPRLSERQFWSGITSFSITLSAQGNMEDACRMARVVVTNTQQTVGSGNQGTLHAYLALGRALRKQRKLNEAEVLLRKASNERVALFGRRGRDTLNLFYELAFTLHLLEKYQEAATFFEEVYRSWTMSRGTDSFLTIQARDHLIDCYRAIGHDQLLIEQKLVELLADCTTSIAATEQGKTSERSKEESARPTKKPRATAEA